MGETITLKTKDGVEISAYVAKPAGKPRAGLVVLQEIFGVNSHIRSVADLYASHGYLVIAPALFDRAERGFEVGYTPDDMQKGFALVQQVKREKTLLDIAAAIDYAKQAGKVGLVGYCWGGTMAYASACQLSGLSAVAGYYGGGIIAMKDETPQVPTILHFGELDKHIPIEGVNEVKKAQPKVPVYVYHADHGFNCDQRGSYDKPSAELARTRTLEFFASHLAA
jgi:carboxymethylenebutenolidase